MLLAGKVTVITGGGRGIGRAIALKFAGEGAATVVAARTESEIEAVAKEIRDAGGRAAAVPADVAQEEQCRHLIGVAESQFGRVDILVNNAGEYGPVKPVEEITPPEWDRVIAVHLRGAYLLTHLVLPGMYARASGVILNISSLSAKSAFGWGSPYAAAKAGMLGLTRVAAADVPFETPGAIERLTRGETVEPLIENTIMEMRANDLFRWLRDFGPRFGWRQTGTPTKLQQEASQGAIGLIVARRKQDGKSGHIVAVVPETATERAAQRRGRSHPAAAKPGRRRKFPPRHQFTQLVEGRSICRKCILAPRLTPCRAVS